MPLLWDLTGRGWTPPCGLARLYPAAHSIVRSYETGPVDHSFMASTVIVPLDFSARRVLKATEVVFPGMRL